MRNTQGGHSSGRPFIAVGRMSLDDVICALLTPPHVTADRGCGNRNCTQIGTKTKQKI